MGFIIVLSSSLMLSVNLGYILIVKTLGILGIIIPFIKSVSIIAIVLGIDTNIAIEVVDFINTYTEKFIRFIEKRILDTSGSSEEGYSIDELSKILRIHKYRLIFAIQSLKSKS
ncbi:MAG: hypothetical protein J7J82_08675 [Staphylothermus sp.]|nr:hypothetical protein [Staphylothermus sp.]